MFNLGDGIVELLIQKTEPDFSRAEQKDNDPDPPEDLEA